MVIASGATGTLSGTDVKKLGGTLENAGTVTYSGTRLQFGLGGGVPGVIDNLATGVFNVPGEGDFGRSATAPHSFNNAGTFTKSGAGTTTEFYYVAFNNGGTADVQQGTLKLRSGGNSSGSFAVASGAVLELAGGTHTLAASSSVSGTGTVQFSNDTTTINGSYAVTNTQVSGGIGTGHLRQQGWCTAIGRSCING